jgi:hypothetical protein
VPRRRPSPTVHQHRRGEARLVDRFARPATARAVMDRADARNAPDDDIRGKKRGDHPDIGAFEVGTPRPASPRRRSGRASLITKLDSAGFCLMNTGHQVRPASGATPERARAGWQRLAAERFRRGSHQQPPESSSIAHGHRGWRTSTEPDRKRAS